jgi:hypothetical protein
MKGTRSRTVKIRQLAMGLAVLLVLAVTALAQSGDGYAVDRWTVDSGGGWLNATEGGFALRGTVGQPDAGPALTGGGYTLSGGFWHATAAPTGHALYLPVVVRDD